MEDSERRRNIETMAMNLADFEALTALADQQDEQIAALQANSATGHWKANRANRFLGRGARSSEFSAGFSKGNLSTCSKNVMCFVQNVRCFFR